MELTALGMHYTEVTVIQVLKGKSIFSFLTVSLKKFVSASVWFYLCARFVDYKIYIMVEALKLKCTSWSFIPRGSISIAVVKVLHNLKQPFVAKFKLSSYNVLFFINFGFFYGYKYKKIFQSEWNHSFLQIFYVWQKSGVKNLLIFNHIERWFVKIIH